MKYGELPEQIGYFDVDCDEMMFYQYLPIKMCGDIWFKSEDRLKCFDHIISTCMLDYVANNGFNSYLDSYVYITVKRMYQGEGNYFNRLGYHSDGFLTDDINYIWSDNLPTTFNTTDFKLTLDDNISMREMNTQADPKMNVRFGCGSLLRLNQFNIHKVSESKETLIRTFLKISISKDKYDLKGNSKNHLLKYDWEMRDREKERNVPQKLNKQ